jgi:hypothetical protein
MDRSSTHTVPDLARDERVRLHRDCLTRTYSRAELAALVGLDARLHLVSLNRTLWCARCGEAPFIGGLTAAVPSARAAAARALALKRQPNQNAPRCRVGTAP